MTDFPAVDDEFAEFKANVVAILPASGAPTTGAKATGTLTINNVVVDGERITLGSRVYEFTTKDDASVDSGANVAVDISDDATKAAGTLTLATQPTAGDTMAIGGKVYTFVAAGTANRDGEIELGEDLAATKPIVVDAINGDDEVNTAHPLVTAADFATNDCVLTAIAGGTEGNAIATLETFNAVDNIFDATKLGTTTAGANCAKGDAQTAIVAAVNADASATVSLGTFSGDASTVTADDEGTAGNSIATTTTGANCSFAAATLSGGTGDTAGLEGQILYHLATSRVYVCSADNTGDLTKWLQVPAVDVGGETHIADPAACAAMTFEAGSIDTGTDMTAAQAAAIVTDLAALKTAIDANNAAIDLILARLEAAGVSATS